ncbi:MAG: TerB family tellurite resistance protein [Myxococcales bacterium]|nr:TerB family tellurite resistance protein [Myxococcales bacterium]
MNEPGKSDDPEDDFDDGDDFEEDPRYDEVEEEAPEVSYMAAIRVWAAAAWADGVIVPQEADAMRRIIRNFPLEPEERETALGWIDSKVGFERNEVVDWPYPIRVGVFRAAAEMVACDDEVVDSEQAFIDRLRAALRIHDDEAAAVMSELAQRKSEA